MAAAAANNVAQNIRPVPTDAYLERSIVAPMELPSPRPLLIVVDLNGTLIHRVDKGGRNRFIQRPGLDDFLDYALAEHKLMVWTSARRANVSKILDRLLTTERRQSLVATWTREELRLPSHLYNRKVQVYKRLSWIWDDATIQATCNNTRQYDNDNDDNGNNDSDKDSDDNNNSDENDNHNSNDKAGGYSLHRCWHQGNTVMIDDSRDKAAAEPYNLIQVPEFTARSTHTSSPLFGGLIDYIRKLSHADDVSRYIRLHPFHQLVIEGSEPPQMQHDEGAGKAAIDRLAEKVDALAVREADVIERVGDRRLNLIPGREMIQRCGAKGTVLVAGEEEEEEEEEGEEEEAAGTSKDEKL